MSGIKSRIGTTAKQIIRKAGNQSAVITKREKGKADRFLLLIVLLLGIFGTVAVYSAGYPYADFRYGDPWYFLRRQIVFLILGIAVMAAASNVTPRLIRKAAPYAYVLTLIMLLATLLVGSVGNGAKRWLSLGPITFQPSEFAKTSLVLILARYYDDHAEKAFLYRSKKDSFLYGTLYPLLLLCSFVILVMLQKHLSCIIILCLLGFLIMLVSGIRSRYLLSFAGAGAAGIAALALFTDYTKERITVWRDPEAYKLTGGWQTLQGLMAIGSGGPFGVGFGKSVLKYCYISEPANDMIFTVICEETGFFGALFVMLLFGLLIWRGFSIAKRTEDVFMRLLAFGITAKIAVQTLLNIAVVTNTIPNTGISLPFFSYGGSSLVMLFLEMGLLLSVSRQKEA